MVAPLDPPVLVCLSYLCRFSLPYQLEVYSVNTYVPLQCHANRTITGP